MPSLTLPLGREAIERILPHRPPFLFIDEVTEASPERLVAKSRFERGMPLLEGHFPGRPVMPGVLLVEAMAQAGLLLYACSYALDDLFFLAKAKSRFHHPVFPPAEIEIVVTRVKFLPTMGLGGGEAWVEGVKVAESELGFARHDASNPLAPADESK